MHRILPHRYPPIQLRGVRVHNLKDINLDIPTGKVVVVCGVSGSGKSSLAFDTLYVEGQRRYIESFSARVRQFLQKVEKPEFERIDHLPVAIAWTHSYRERVASATVGSASEVIDYLRITYARLSTLYCRRCGRRIDAHSPQTVARVIQGLASSTRCMIITEFRWEQRLELSHRLADLQQSGLVRIIAGGRTLNMTTDRAEMAKILPDAGTAWVVIDRIHGGLSNARLMDSLETAFNIGDGIIGLLVAEDPAQAADDAVAAQHDDVLQIDHARYRLSWYCRSLRCHHCAIDYPWPEPNLFNNLHALGACPQCHGSGVEPSAARKADAADVDGRREPQRCAACDGTGLRPEALSFQIGDANIARTAARDVDSIYSWFGQMEWSSAQRELAGQVLDGMAKRLKNLCRMGLGYLTLDRDLQSLSRGEAHRVAFTGILASNLSNVLYVFDEPTAGLHPSESRAVSDVIQEIRDRNNSIVVVSHDIELVRSADWIVELGPHAGVAGGRVVYNGEADQLSESGTLTGKYLARIATSAPPTSKRPLDKGAIQLRGASGHHLKDIDAEFPLGCLCVVNGPSGSGKTSLVIGTLYGAVRHRLGQDPVITLPYKAIRWKGRVHHVVAIEQEASKKSRRSCPATVCKVFDDIRKLYAQTSDAELHGWTASHFSFNNELGRCPECSGDGELDIDMQFLPDVSMVCGTCQGKRYRHEVLKVMYRDRSIADVLQMSVSQAREFFRGQPHIQLRLHAIEEIGLGYLTLGQSTSTLSSGETQRLKLGTFLGGMAKPHTLFLLDEPASGLHFADVESFLMCLDKLIDAGHSFIVVDHHPLITRAADHIIELGPGAGEHGGAIVRTV